MGNEITESMGAFESWLLRRVAQAVEAGDVPGDLLMELHTEFEASRAKPPERSHADATQDIAVELQMPVEKVEAGLAALEAQPRVVFGSRRINVIAMRAGKRGKAN